MYKKKKRVTIHPKRNYPHPTPLSPNQSSEKNSCASTQYSNDWSLHWLVLLEVELEEVVGDLGAALPWEHVHAVPGHRQGKVAAGRGDVTALVHLFGARQQADVKRLIMRLVTAHMQHPQNKCSFMTYTYIHDTHSQHTWHILKKICGHSWHKPAQHKHVHPWYIPAARTYVQDTPKHLRYSCALTMREIQPFSFSQYSYNIHTCTRSLQWSILMGQVERQSGILCQAHKVTVNC